MEHLIEDLLDMSLLRAGRTTITRSPVNAVVLVQETQRLLEPLATARGLTIELDVPEEPVDMLADGMRVREILSNLVGNAIKFTPEGGVVTIGLDVSDDEIGVLVTDTGPGIPEERLPTLFVPYLDAKPREQREAQAGLGLAIASEIAKAHGGRIEVESTLGEGSTFLVTLPVG
jgi:signal transduction histidine kinase